MEMLDRADYRIWLHFCDLLPNAEREKNHLNFCTLFFAVANGGKRTQAEQASVVTIIPLPLGILILEFWI